VLDPVLERMHTASVRDETCPILRGWDAGKLLKEVLCLEAASYGDKAHRNSPFGYNYHNLKYFLILKE
jgi:hypothetical protein